MRKIFISGSISSKEIPQEVIKSVDDSRKRNYTILIGDAKGIDKNIQDMLKADNYKNVEVYHVGPSPRNLSDLEWIDRRIPVDTENEKFFKNGKYTREAQMIKDKAMSKDGLFYIPKPEKGIMKFKNIAEFEEQVIEKLVQKETKDYYYKMKKNANKSNNKYSEHGNNEQLSLFG